MMWVSAKNQGDLTKIVEIATLIYGNTNSDGTGYAYVNSEGNIIVEKTEEEAKYFWLKNNKKIISKSVIAHVRLGTNGGVKKENSHPFLNENGEMALCHNGIVSDYSTFERELKNKGHKFSSQTDSEILLHSYEEYGNDFIAKLKEMKVSGSVTLLILLKDGTIAVYTNNGSMKVYETDIGIISFSNDSIFTTKKEIEIKNGIIYFFKDGKLINEIEVGDVYERFVYAKNDFVRYDVSEKIENLLAKQLGLDYNNISFMFKKNDKIKFSAWAKSRDVIKKDKKLIILKNRMKESNKFTELIWETDLDKILIVLARINSKLAIEIRNAVKEDKEETEEAIIINNGQVMNGFDNVRGGFGYWD